MWGVVTVSDGGPVGDDDGPRCVAKAKGTGAQCRRRPISGGTVCYIHGGRAPQVKAAAARRLALGRLTAELEQAGRIGGGTVEVEPADAMLAMVHECAWNVAVLRDLVAQLDARVAAFTLNDDGDRPVGFGAIAGLLGSTSKALEAAPNVLVGMYDQERDRLVKYAKMCRDAGVDERMVAVTETQAQTLAAVLEAAMTGLLALVVAAVGDDVVAGRVRARWDAEAGRVVGDAVRAQIGAGVPE